MGKMRRIYKICALVITLMFVITLSAIIIVRGLSGQPGVAQKAGAVTQMTEAGSFSGSQVAGTPADIAPPTAVASPAISPASIVVSSFLQSLQLDMSGAHASDYLGQQLTGGAGATPAAVDSLLGIQDIYGSFDVTTLAGGSGAGNALVKATLRYSTPVERLFTLTQQAGEWKIVEIQASEDGLPYPSSPGDVVDAFLTAYRQHDDASNSRRYLSDARKANVSMSGYAAMLSVSGGVSGVTISPAVVKGAKASVTTCLTINGNDEVRVFTLIYERSNWRIDAVTAPR